VGTIFVYIRLRVEEIEVGPRLVIDGQSLVGSVITMVDKYLEAFIGYFTPPPYAYERCY
jgi:hypothetical protein